MYYVQTSVDYFHVENNNVCLKSIGFQQSFIHIFKELLEKFIALCSWNWYYIKVMSNESMKKSVNVFNTSTYTFLSTFLKIQSPQSPTMRDKGTTPPPPPPRISSATAGDPVPPPPPSMTTSQVRQYMYSFIIGEEFENSERISLYVPMVCVCFLQVTIFDPQVFSKVLRSLLPCKEPFFLQ